MKPLPLITLFLIALNMACIEDYNLQIGNADSKIVVDGVITNEPGPYFVRLIYSSNVTKEYPEDILYDNEIPVMNAQVIIADDHGQVDTLMPIDINPDDYIPDLFLGYYKLVYDSIAQKYDTVILEYPFEFNHDRGFYKTTTLKGIPNRTYKLSVLVNGVEYTATDYMMEVPSIDSLGYDVELSIQDEPIVIPKVYFKEPQNQDNYYLFETSDYSTKRFEIISRIWRYSILSDEYLEPYVNGLQIDDGASPDGIEFYEFYWEGQTIEVTMSSISRNAYNYFKGLIEQFEADGGAFKPTPASPPTNLSNGALGFFRASAVTQYKTEIKTNK